MPCFLPVQVRPRELAVCPRSYTRHGRGAIQTRESLSVTVLVGEGRASLRAVALSEPCSLVKRPTPAPTCVGHVDAEPLHKWRRPERMVKHSQRQPSGPPGYGGRHEGTETGLRGAPGAVRGNRGTGPSGAAGRHRPGAAAATQATRARNRRRIAARGERGVRRRGPGGAAAGNGTRRGDGGEHRRRCGVVATVTFNCRFPAELLFA